MFNPEMKNIRKVLAGVKVPSVFVPLFTRTVWQTRTCVLVRLL